MTRDASSNSGGSSTTSWRWIVVSMLIVIGAVFSLRWASNVGQQERVWDEHYILVPIMDLVDRGWSVETAIDFQEAKGPAMIWPYAIWAEICGSSINTIRLFSVLCFILTLLPLMWLALRCGLPPPALPLVAIGLVLLPFELVVSQLVMGEPSFVLGVACLLAVVLWSTGDRDHLVSPLVSRFIGPVIYTLLLAFLLYSRIHAVPIAGGICLALAWRDGFRSWPWWVGSIVAGLLRIPLWVRWGGLVSPDYQDMHGLGIRLESLSYLGAALTIPLGIFLLVWFWKYRYLTWWWLAPAGGLCGLTLGLIASPDLVDPQSWGVVRPGSMFMGPTRSLAISLMGEESLQWIPMAILSAIGLGGLGALGAMALEARSDRAVATLARVQFFTLFCAWGLYLFTRGFVFDRFLLAWIAALPVLWVCLLPRWAWLLQMLGLAAFLVASAAGWLW